MLNRRPPQRTAPKPEPVPGVPGSETGSLAGTLSGRHYIYTAFGQQYGETSAETVPQRYTFTGREAAGPAAAAGGAPMYYRYRMYSPGLGRFGRRDPVLGGDKQYNAYGFPGASALGRGDPFGLGQRVFVACYTANEPQDDSSKVAVWITYLRGVYKTLGYKTFSSRSSRQFAEVLQGSYNTCMARSGSSYAKCCIELLERRGHGDAGVGGNQSLSAEQVRSLRKIFCAGAVFKNWGCKGGHAFGWPDYASMALLLSKNGGTYAGYQGNVTGYETEGAFLRWLIPVIPEREIVPRISALPEAWVGPIPYIHEDILNEVVGDLGEKGANDWISQWLGAPPWDRSDMMVKYEDIARERKEEELLAREAELARQRAEAETLRRLREELSNEILEIMRNPRPTRQRVGEEIEVPVGGVF